MKLGLRGTLSQQEDLEVMLEVSQGNDSNSQHRVLDKGAHVSDKVEATGRRLAL